MEGFQNETTLLKIIVVGDTGVGKTALLNSYVYGFFNENISATVGCDFKVKTIPNEQCNKQLKLQLWDIAGQERYKSITKVYIRGSVCCIVVTDMSKNENLQKQSAQSWKQLIEEYDSSINLRKMPIILVSNKCDLVSEEVQQRMLSNMKPWVERQGFIGHIQTSAKTQINLDLLFQNLVQNIIKNNLHQQVNGFKNQFKQTAQNKKIKKCICI